MHSKNLRFRAFTLVELLVVMAIVGTLVSLLLPSLSGARRTAKGVACLSGMRSIGQGVVMYADANKDRFPLSSHATGNITSSDCWLNSLRMYGVEPRMRRCAMDKNLPSAGAVTATSTYTSYATNEHMEKLTLGVDYDIARMPIAGGRTRVFGTLSSVPRPSVTVYVYEPNGGSSTDHLNTHAWKTSRELGAAVAVTRHSQSGHFAFVDGHASAWAWSELQVRFVRGSPFDPETAQ